MRRRTFLLAGLGAGSALFLGWSVVPPRQRLRGSANPGLPAGTVALNGWLAIAPDDTVTILSPKADMGQGVHTALAMLVMEELRGDWEHLVVTPAPDDGIYRNISAFVEALPIRPDDAGTPLVRTLRWYASKLARDAGVQITAGSSSMADVWQIARMAGATARAQLVEEAAARWKLPLDQCQVDQGVVSAPNGRSFRFGELAAAAAQRTPRRVVLTEPARFTRIGKDTPQLRTKDRVTGALRYGIDVRVESADIDHRQRYAAVAMPPALGCTVEFHDAGAARRLPGVRAVVPLAGSAMGDRPGVAVIADGWWQATQALNALAIRWSPSPHAALSSAGLMTTLIEEAGTDGGWSFGSVGDVTTAFEQADRVVDVTYTAPYLAHASLEPPNATVRVSADHVEVWVGTQIPHLVRQAVATALDRSVDAVTVHVLPMGGSFGRRLEVDFVVQAAHIAVALPDTPVQTLWSRDNDLRQDFYRPAAASRWRAALDADGRITAIAAQTASQSPLKALSRRAGIPWSSYGPDRYASEGMWDQPYEFPALHTAHTELHWPVPVGSWRSVGHSLNGFFLESFIDELAIAARQDPVAFRLQWLARHPRALAVLRAVAERSAWSTPLVPAPDGRRRARGVALHAMVGSMAAAVVEISLRPDGTVQVHRVTCAVDCGLAVNPSGIRQQVEGSVVFGLSAALRQEIQVDHGVLSASNFHQYDPLRMHESPVIDTIILPSSEPPSGVGEVVVPTMAPAVANALFTLTGSRVRSLPLHVPVAPLISAPTVR